MNRKGFTLVEVILVIVIMAILLLIIVPNVFVLLEKNNEKSCNSLLNNIESSTKIYITNNKYDLGFTCGGTKNITIQTLVDSGDLTLDSSGKIINPVNDKEISDNCNDNDNCEQIIISVTYNCSTKDFVYEINGIDCTNE